MSLKRKSAAKQPYEGYALPKSSEKGGQFVDFNKILKMSQQNYSIIKDWVSNVSRVCNY